MRIHSVTRHATLAASIAWRPSPAPHRRRPGEDRLLRHRTRRSLVGFQRIVDDTGTVAISVPASWTNVPRCRLSPRTAPSTRTSTPPAGQRCVPGGHRVGRALPPARESRTSPGARAPCSRTPAATSPGSVRDTGCDTGLLYQYIVASPSAQQFTVTVSFAYGAQPTSRPWRPSPTASKRLATSTRRRRRRHPSVASSGVTKRSRRGRRRASPPPPIVDLGAPLWPYGPFWNAPQLAVNRCAAPAAAARARSATSSPTACGPATSPTRAAWRSTSTCCASCRAGSSARDHRGHRQHRQQ